MRPVRPSSHQPPPVCLSPHQSVLLSVHPTDNPSVIPARLSYEPSVHPPVTLSMTRQSATPPVSLVQHQSDRPSPSDHLHTIRPAKRPSDRPSLSDRLYTILPRPSDCPTLSDPTSTTPTSLSDHLQPSYCLYDTPTSPSDHPQPSHHLYDTPTRPSDHPPPSLRL